MPELALHGFALGDRVRRGPGYPGGERSPAFRTQAGTVVLLSPRDRVYVLWDGQRWPKLAFGTWLEVAAVASLERPGTASTG